MGCDKTQEKKTRINDAGWDGPTNQQQSDIDTALQYKVVVIYKLVETRY